MKVRVRLIVLASLMLPAVAQQPQTRPPAPNAKGSHAVAGRAPVAGLELGQRLDGNAVVIDLNGKPCRLAELLSKVTVINFHSTQSKTQREADAHLATLQREHAKNGVGFVHLNSNATEIGLRAQQTAATDKAGSPKPYARLRNYLDQHKLPFRMFADHHNRVADALGAVTTPHVFVFADNGTLIYRGLAKDHDHNHLSEVLTKLVAGTKVKPFESRAHGNAISRAKARTTAKRHTIVTDDISLAKTTSRRAGKLLIYNFTGFNCGSCRMMEQVVFTKESVSALMRTHVVESRLHCDTQNVLTADQLAANRKLQADLAKTKATPFYVAVHQTTGETLGTFSLTGSFDKWPAQWTAFVTDMAEKAGRVAK